MSEAAPQIPLLNQTPMMKQWSALKALASDSLLFFRLGDFYELFGTDAEIAGPILGIVVTSRNKKDENAPALCGIPLHQFDNYIGKLLDRGYSVALAEQMEEPTPGKTLVRREIIQWLTPGIRLLPNDERPHYAATFLGDLNAWSVAAADVNTGHAFVTEGRSLEDLQELIDRGPIQDLRWLSPKPEGLRIHFHRPANPLVLADADQAILKFMNLSEIEDAQAPSKNARVALGSLLQILADAHPQDRLKFFASLPESDAVQMSAATRRNLNLFEPESKNIFSILDRTCTAFGRRELKRILSEPTQNRDTLEERQTWIRFFKSQTFIRKQIRERMNAILDIHRLIRKQRGPQDLLKLSVSLRSSLESAQLLPPENKLFAVTRQRAETLHALTENLEKSLVMSDSSEVGWIRSGVLPQLDELRHLQSHSEQLLSQLEQKLKDETKIGSLKVKYHQILGYVFEATSVHKDKIPSTVRRVQSLANSERFKTQELESLEEKLLSVTERIREAERAEIERLYREVAQSSEEIINFVSSLSLIDVAQALAEVSVDLGWTTPRLATSPELRAQDVKHPLIAGFVPLSLDLSQKSTQVLLLTGPNMAGKSTVLRVAALLALLHQIGSDVPAKEFESGLFDRIMCRMGAQDDVITGQSTFFVEMKEVAQMLSGATSKSLLIFDEIGRGTSTYDGMSLAWSIAESVHQAGPLSLIATHYLELAELEKSCAHLKSFHLGVEERSGQLVFTRKLMSGLASRSYGIQVARLAQIPEDILVRAERKLSEFESQKPPQKRERLPLFEWKSAQT